jgi:hypothetical protein
MIAPRNEEFIVDDMIANMQRLEPKELASAIFALGDSDRAMLRRIFLPSTEQNQAFVKDISNPNSSNYVYYLAN